MHACDAVLRRVHNTTLEPAWHPSVALRNADASVALFTIQRPCGTARRMSIQSRQYSCEAPPFPTGERHRRRATAAAATGTAQEAEEKKGVEKCVGAIRSGYCFPRILFGSSITIHLCRHLP